MKKLLLILVVVTTVFNCSRDDDRNVSALEQFVGEWELQSRMLNNSSPLTVENDKLRITEDNDFSDFKGNYEFINEASSSGSFNIDIYNKIVFTTDNGISKTYGFTLTTITLRLSYTEDNGDEISETWIKDY